VEADLGELELARRLLRRFGLGLVVAGDLGLTVDDREKFDAGGRGLAEIGHVHGRRSEAGGEHEHAEDREEERLHGAEVAEDRHVLPAREVEGAVPVTLVVRAHRVVGVDPVARRVGVLFGLLRVIDQPPVGDVVHDAKADEEGTLREQAARALRKRLDLLGGQERVEGLLELADHFVLQAVRVDRADRAHGLAHDRGGRGAHAGFGVGRGGTADDRELDNHADHHKGEHAEEDARDLRRAQGEGEAHREDDREAEADGLAKGLAGQRRDCVSLLAEQRRELADGRQVVVGHVLRDERPVELLAEPLGHLGLHHTEAVRLELLAELAHERGDDHHTAPGRAVVLQLRGVPFEDEGDDLGEDDAHEGVVDGGEGRARDAHVEQLSVLRVQQAPHAALGRLLRIRLGLCLGLLLLRLGLLLLRFGREHSEHARRRLLLVALLLQFVRLPAHGPELDVAAAFSALKRQRRRVGIRAAEVRRADSELARRVRGAQWRSCLGSVRGLGRQHEFVVSALRLHELVVGALLDQITAVEHHNLVGVADGREAVRDHEGGHVVLLE